MKTAPTTGDRRWRLPLILQSATLQAAWVGARLMIGYRALDLGAGALGLGIVAASFAVPALLSALPAGRLADRFGGIKLVVAGIGVQVVGIVGAALTTTMPWLVIASAGVGLGQILNAVGQQSFVAERADRNATDSAFGFLTSAISIGQVIGPPVVAWVATAGWRSGIAQPDTTLALFAAAALVLLALPASWVLLKAPASPRPLSRGGTRRADTRAMVRTLGLWRALIVSGVVLASLDMLYAFLPAWAAENAVAVSTVGWLLALRAAVTVVSRVGLGRLVAKLGRRILLLISLSLAAVALCALPFVGAPGAVAVMIGLGIGFGLPQPLTMAWVVAKADPRVRGAALGLRLTSNRALQIAVPIAVGAAAGPIGSDGIFWTSAVLLAGATAVVASAGSSLDTEAPPGPTSE